MKVNAITEMGLFKMNRGKFHGTGTPYADAKQMGILDGCNRPIFLNWEFYYKKEKGRRGPPKYNKEVFVSELCCITSVVAPLVC